MTAQSASALRRFLSGIAPVALIVLGAGALLVATGLIRQIESISERESERVVRAATLVKNSTEEARSDAAIFASSHEVRDLLGGSRRDLPALQQEWLKYLAIKPHYDQIRLLGPSGRELVRIERTADGTVRQVPQAELQDKSARGYFVAATRPRGGELFISAMDLNVENGKIDVPYKPTLRYSAALRDDAGRLLGVAVLNIRARYLLDELRKTLRGTLGSYGMVNARGYALISDREADEWAFMFPGGEARTLAKQDPVLWRRLAEGAPLSEFAHGELLTRIRLCAAVRGCRADEPGSLELDFDSPDQPWIIFTRATTPQLLWHALAHWSSMLFLAVLAIILLLGAVAARAALRLRRTVEELTASREELRQRGAMLNAFVENNPAFMHVKDAAGRFLFANKAYQRFALRGKEGGIVGRLHAELFSPEVAREVQLEEAAVLRTGTPSDVQRATDAAHGGRYVHAFKFPMRDDEGRTTAVGTISLDVTESVRAEQAREESEKRFRAVLDAAPDAIVLSDRKGRITMTNPASERMFGYARGDFEGVPVSSLVDPKQRDELTERLERALAATPVESADSAHRFDGLRKDGSTFPLEMTCSALDTAAGPCAISIARDVTERRRLEQQLVQSQKLEAVGQLTGGVAHDFNNLLGVVIGNLDLLERAVAADASALARVQTAQRAALRGAELTKRLLAFARRQQLEPAPLRVDRAISDIVEMAARILGPEIRIETRLDPSVPAVFVDAAGFESAILNLAINARDAMPDGGTLRIASSAVALDAQDAGVRAGELKEGAYASIQISDTGTGMPAEILQRAFEPFFTTKERGKGTGLGLAMVYGFMKQSGGNVKIYSEPGRGTTVGLMLPVAEGGAEAGRAAPAGTHRARPGDTALVVDDEPDLLEVGATYLEEMGYRVLKARDAAAALALAQDEARIELLVTDVIMPGGMNGVELAERMRTLRPETRIVFSSGFPSRALAERAGTRVDGPLLNKPYARGELAALLERVMREGVES